MNALNKIDPDPNIRGHVFLLGAGASFAACPGGDANGKTLPLMRDLVSILGIKNDLRNLGFESDFSNFELVYSQLISRKDCQEFVERLNGMILNYFSGLELPKAPTIYDKLLLSLRPKDCIATFNWDPFLWQAWARVYKIAPLPRTLCLHGSVSLGYCQCEDPIIVSYIQNPCPKCGSKMQNASLLYPVGQKDYTSSPFISAAWRDMKTVLTNSMLFSVFGYAAPESDVEAVELLKEGWWNVSDREVEQIEIIDIVDEEVLATRWCDFTHNYHYGTMTDFHSSSVWHHPRRSCEVHWSTCMQLLPVKDNRLSPDAGWQELLDHIQPLVNDEKKLE